MAEPALSPRANSLAGLLKYAVFFIPLLVLGGVYVKLMYFLCDDAYITFRYARNFVSGHGIVFNPGEYVEGYTNFLWLLQLSALWKLASLGPEPSSVLLSLSYSVGSLYIAFRMGLSSPFKPKLLVAWLTVLFLVCNQSFAVWATSGLETRSFTFFIQLGAWLLYSKPRSLLALVIASIMLGLCELTRPEGALVGATFLGCYLAIQFVQKTVNHKLCAAAILPFVLIVMAHYIWRYFYYGDWLPNTYYAKHVRSWPEAGARYYLSVLIEYGWYLVIPLTAIAALARVRRGDHLYLYFLALVIPHVVYLGRVGGDHFEYRPLDFYWPFLACGAADGIVFTSSWLAQLFREDSRRTKFVLAAVITGVVLCYSSAIQVARYVTTRSFTDRKKTTHLAISVRPDTFPAAFYLPGMDFMASVFNDLQNWCAKRHIATPQREHLVFWKTQMKGYAPYLEAERSPQMPKGAIMGYPNVGVVPFHLPRVTIIDYLGLTDRHVARQPVDTPNENRVMAHDRYARPSYLRKRKVNIYILPAAQTVEEALTRAPYAITLVDKVVMPFKVVDEDWATKAFKNKPVYAAEGCSLNPLKSYQTDGLNFWR